MRPEIRKAIEENRANNTGKKLAEIGKPKARLIKKPNRPSRSQRYKARFRIDKDDAALILRCLSREQDYYAGSDEAYADYVASVKHKIRAAF